MIRLRTLAIVVLALVASLSGRAAEPMTPASVVETFHEALAQGDRDGALDVLSPGVVIYESGWVEVSRDEYALHHLGSDMEFSAATEREIVSRSEHSDGDTAWVVTESATTGEFRDRAIDLIGVETMILEKSDDGWKIVHVHWSSRARPTD